MNQILFLSGIVIILCILMGRLTSKLAVPSLLFFIALGMVFGENGLFRIAFDDFAAAETVCSVSLIFIMFYGGFGTNINAARPVAVRAVLLSTLGVVLTAAAVGTFAHLALGLSWAEGLLVGSVIASTDAASVFHILRSKQLGLRYHTASLIEVESGSNDPMSYMLTVVMIAVLAGGELSVPLVLFRQIGIGILCGVLIGKVSVRILNRFFFQMNEGRTIFAVAAMLLSYALPALLGGNGYLSVYLAGVLTGNAALPEKRHLVQFFDAVTGIAQMMIFFLLGLLVTPSELPEVLLPALLIMGFLTLFARPAAVAAILLPFRAPLCQIGVVSFAGLRGAASIVFAILVMLSGIPMRCNLYNLVFCIVLFSIALQGSLLPFVSKRLNMLDPDTDVRKTFTDYVAESDVSFIKTHVDEDHAFFNRKLREICLPAGFLVVMILRGEERIIPNGETLIEKGDLLILAAPEFTEGENLTLEERIMEKGHRWTGKKLKELSLPEGTLIVTVKRGGATLIPMGDTVIRENDTLFVARF